MALKEELHNADIVQALTNGATPPKPSARDSLLQTKAASLANVLNAKRNSVHNLKATRLAQVINHKYGMGGATPNVVGTNSDTLSTGEFGNVTFSDKVNPDPVVTDVTADPLTTPKSFTEENEIFTAIDGAAEEFGLPKALFRSLVFEESGNKQTAKSPTNVRGIAQVTQQTMEEMLPGGDVNNAAHQLYAGAKYLSKHVNRWKLKGFDERQAQQLAAASYNTGFSRVLEAIKATKKTHPTMQEIETAGIALFKQRPFKGGVKEGPGGKKVATKKRKDLDSFKEGMGHWKKIHYKDGVLQDFTKPTPQTPFVTKMPEAVEETSKPVSSQTHKPEDKPTPPPIKTIDPSVDISAPGGIAKAVQEAPPADVDLRDTGADRRKAERLQAQRREFKRIDELRKITNKADKEEVVLTPTHKLPHLKEHKPPTPITKPPSVDIDRRDPGKDRARAEKLQAEQRKFKRIDQELSSRKKQKKFSVDSLSGYGDFATGRQDLSANQYLNSGLDTIMDNVQTNKKIIEDKHDSAYFDNKRKQALTKRAEIISDPKGTYQQPAVTPEVPETVPEVTPEAVPQIDVPEPDIYSPRSVPKTVSENIYSPATPRPAEAKTYEDLYSSYKTPNEALIKEIYKLPDFTPSSPIVSVNRNLVELQDGTYRLLTQDGTWMPFSDKIEAQVFMAYDIANYQANLLDHPEETSVSGMYNKLVGGLVDPVETIFQGFVGATTLTEHINDHNNRLKAGSFLSSITHDPNDEITQQDKLNYLAIQENKGLSAELQAFKDSEKYQVIATLDKDAKENQDQQAKLKEFSKIWHEAHPYNRKYIESATTAMRVIAKEHGNAAAALELFKEYKGTLALQGLDSFGYTVALVYGNIPVQLGLLTGLARGRTKANIEQYVAEHGEKALTPEILTDIKIFSTLQEVSEKVSAGIVVKQLKLIPGLGGAGLWGTQITNGVLATIHPTVRTLGKVVWAPPKMFGAEFVQGTTNSMLEQAALQKKVDIGKAAVEGGIPEGFAVGTMAPAMAVGGTAKEVTKKVAKKAWDPSGKKAAAKTDKATKQKIENEIKSTQEKIEKIKKMQEAPSNLKSKLDALTEQLTDLQDAYDEIPNLHGKTLSLPGRPGKLETTNTLLKKLYKPYEQLVSDGAMSLDDAIEAMNDDLEAEIEKRLEEKTNLEEQLPDPITLEDTVEYVQHEGKAVPVGIGARKMTELLELELQLETKIAEHKSNVEKINQSDIPGPKKQEAIKIEEQKHATYLEGAIKKQDKLLNELQAPLNPTMLKVYEKQLIDVNDRRTKVLENESYKASPKSPTMPGSANPKGFRADGTGRDVDKISDEEVDAQITLIKKMSEEEDPDITNFDPSGKFKPGDVVHLNTTDEELLKKGEQGFVIETILGKQERDGKVHVKLAGVTETVPIDSLIFGNKPRTDTTPSTKLDHVEALIDKDLTDAQITKVREQLSKEIKELEEKIGTGKRVLGSLEDRLDEIEKLTPEELEKKLAEAKSPDDIKFWTAKLNQKRIQKERGEKQDAIDKDMATVHEEILEGESKKFKGLHAYYTDIVTALTELTDHVKLTRRLESLVSDMRTHATNINNKLNAFDNAYEIFTSTGKAVAVVGTKAENSRDMTYEVVTDMTETQIDEAHKKKLYNGKFAYVTKIDKNSGRLIDTLAGEVNYGNWIMGVVEGHRNTSMAKNEFNKARNLAEHEEVLRRLKKAKDSLKAPEIDEATIEGISVEDIPTTPTAILKENLEAILQRGLELKKKIDEGTITPEEKNEHESLQQSYIALNKEIQGREKIEGAEPGEQLDLFPEGEVPERSDEPPGPTTTPFDETTPPPRPGEKGEQLSLFDRSAEDTTEKGTQLNLFPNFIEGSKRIYKRAITGGVLKVLGGKLTATNLERQLKVLGAYFTDLVQIGSTRPTLKDAVNTLMDEDFDTQESLVNALMNLGVTQASAETLSKNFTHFKNRYDQVSSIDLSRKEVVIRTVNNVTDVDKDGNPILWKVEELSRDINDAYDKDGQYTRVSREIKDASGNIQTTTKVLPTSELLNVRNHALRAPLTLLLQEDPTGNNNQGVLPNQIVFTMMLTAMSFRQRTPNNNRFKDNDFAKEAFLYSGKNQTLNRNEDEELNDVGFGYHDAAMDMGNHAISILDLRAKKIPKDSPIDQVGADLYFELLAPALGMMALEIAQGTDKGAYFSVEKKYWNFDDYNENRAFNNAPTHEKVSDNEEIRKKYPEGKPIPLEQQQHYLHIKVDENQKWNQSTFDALEEMKSISKANMINSPGPFQTPPPINPSTGTFTEAPKGGEVYETLKRLQNVVWSKLESMDLVADLRDTDVLKELMDVEELYETTEDGEKIQLFHDVEIASKTSRNNGMLDTLQELLQAYDRGELTAFHLAWKLQSHHRYMQVGKINPQNSKLTRGLVGAWGLNKISVDNEQQFTNFKLAINEAFAVEKKDLVESEEAFQNIINHSNVLAAVEAMQRLNAAKGILRTKPKDAKAKKDKDRASQDLSSALSAIKKDNTFKEADITLLNGITALSKYMTVEAIQKTKAGYPSRNKRYTKNFRRIEDKSKSTFETDLYTERDGTSNGWAINVLQFPMWDKEERIRKNSQVGHNLKDKSFDPKEPGVYEDLVKFMQNNDSADVAWEWYKDKYKKKVFSRVSKDLVDKKRYTLTKEGEANFKEDYNKINAALIIIYPEFRDQESMREVVKYPFIMKMYGGGIANIANEVSNEVNKAMYSRISTIQKEYKEIFNNEEEELLRSDIPAFLTKVTNRKGVPDAKQYAKEDLTNRIYTLRIFNSNTIPGLTASQHFGNPWASRDIPGTIKTPDIKTAVNNYKAWLEGTAHQDVEPNRRKWIRKQIGDGNLDDKELVYYTTLSEPSHADVLRDLVEETSKTALPVDTHKYKRYGFFENRKNYEKQIITPFMDALETLNAFNQTDRGALGRMLIEGTKKDLGITPPAFKVKLNDIQVRAELNTRVAPRFEASLDELLGDTVEPRQSIVEMGDVLHQVFMVHFEEAIKNKLDEINLDAPVMEDVPVEVTQGAYTFNVIKTKDGFSITNKKTGKPAPKNMAAKTRKAIEDKATEQLRAVRPGLTKQEVIDLVKDKQGLMKFYPQVAGALATRLQDGTIEGGIDLSSTKFTTNKGDIEENQAEINFYDRERQKDTSRSTPKRSLVFDAAGLAVLIRQVINQDASAMTRLLLKKAEINALHDGFNASSNWANYLTRTYNKIHWELNTTHSIMEAMHNQMLGVLRNTDRKDIVDAIELTEKEQKRIAREEKLTAKAIQLMEEFRQDIDNRTKAAKLNDFIKEHKLDADRLRMGFKNAKVGKTLTRLDKVKMRVWEANPEYLEWNDKSSLSVISERAKAITQKVREQRQKLLEDGYTNIDHMYNLSNEELSETDTLNEFEQNYNKNTETFSFTSFEAMGKSMGYNPKISRDSGNFNKHYREQTNLFPAYNKDLDIKLTKLGKKLGLHSLDAFPKGEITSTEELGAITSDNVRSLFNKFKALSGKYYDSQDEMDSHTSTLNEVLDIISDGFQETNDLTLTMEKIEGITQATYEPESERITMSVSQLPPRGRNGQSPQEAYLHEMVHAMTLVALEEDPVLADRLESLHNELEAELHKDFKGEGWKVFRPKGTSPVNLATGAETNLAKAQYKHAFDTANSKDRLTEFLSMALTNRSLIDYMKSKQLAKDRSYLTKFMEFVQSIVNAFKRILNKKVESNNTTAYAEAIAITEQLVAMQNKHKSKYGQLDSKTIQFLERSDARIIEFFDQAVATVAAETEKYGPGGETAPIPFKVATMGTYAGYLTMSDSVHAKATRDHIMGLLNFTMRGVAKEIGGGALENPKLVEQLLHSKINISKRRREAETFSNEWFKTIWKSRPDDSGDDKWMSFETREALTDVLLRADLSSLRKMHTLGFADKDPNATRKIMNLLGEDKVARIERSRLKDQIRRQLGLTKDSEAIAYADELGYWIATGKRKKHDAYTNAYSIALDHLEGDFTPAQVNLLDAYATISSIPHLDILQREKVQQLSTREFNADPDANGMIDLLDNHIWYKTKSQRDLFDGDPVQMVKGYIVERLDNLTDIKIGSAADKDKMAARGYKHPYPLGKIDKSQTLDTMYINRNIPEVADISGIMSTTNQRHMGTSLTEILLQNPAYVHPATGKPDFALIKSKIDSFKKFSGNLAKNLGFDERFAFTPIRDQNNRITDYRIMMNHSDVKELLRPDLEIQNVLAHMESGYADRSNTIKNDMDTIDLLIHEQEDLYGKHPEQFVDFLDPDSKYIDRFRKLPKAIRTYIQEYAVNGKFMVREDIIDKVFGYRQLDITQMKVFEGDSWLAQVSKQIAGLLHYALRQTVGYGKSRIVLTMPAVVFGNLRSNIFQLLMRKIPLSFIFKKTIEGINEYIKYKDHNIQHAQLMHTIETKGLDRVNSPEAFKARRLMDRIQRNKLHRMSEAGLNSLIVEDVNEAQIDGYWNRMKRTIFKGKFKKVGDRIPQSLQTIASWAFMTKGSAPLQAARQLVQMTDFMGRYVMMEHAMHVKGQDFSTAMHDALTAFVLFDEALIPVLEALDVIGATAFLSYYLRNTRASRQLLKTSPTAVGVSAVIQEITGVPTLANINSSWLGGQFSPNVFQTFNLVDEADNVTGYETIMDVAKWVN